MSMAAPTALAQFGFVAMAFTALAICYRDFGFFGFERI
jgi:hypothetical protein